MVPIKSYEPVKIWPMSERGKATKTSDLNGNHTIIFSTSNNPIFKFQGPIYQNAEFKIFTTNKITYVFLVFVVFFSRSDQIGQGDPIRLGDG